MNKKRQFVVETAKQVLANMVTQGQQTPDATQAVAMAEALWDALAAKGYVAPSAYQAKEPSAHED